MVSSFFTPSQLAFLQKQHVGRLATANTSGTPTVIPVCYACDGLSFFIALDAKPKTVAPTQLQRVRNILENPRVALVIDHYSDDWHELAYLLVHGRAELLPTRTPEHEQAIRLLRARYVQYQTMPIEAQPVIAIRVQRVKAWRI